MVRDRNQSTNGTDALGRLNSEPVRTDNILYFKKKVCQITRKRLGNGQSIDIRFHSSPRHITPGTVGHMLSLHI